jgi:mono/diheme cytochrome c family protein
VRSPLRILLPAGVLLLTAQVPPGDRLAATLGCGACHAGIAAPTSAGAIVARDPAVLLAWLLDPPRGDPGEARMPSFRLTEGEAAALTLAIADGRPGSDGGDARRFRDIIRAHPEATTEAGARIRAALNCDACHGGEVSVVAPPLADVVRRVRPEWLRAFLARPHDVRPLGWLPGTGTRMPDFRLTGEEIDSLTTWFARIGGGASAAVSETVGGARASSAAAAPSTRAAATTLTLMRERWGCMGCHAWNGEGGRIGPDLARTGARLRPEEVDAIVADPDRVLASGIMPRPPLNARDRARIVALLTSADGTGSPSPPLSLLTHATVAPPPSGETTSSYMKRCSSCHGIGGNGDGWNAVYLRSTPTPHANADSMRVRTDDRLYDGIHAGGRILGGSGDMPAFGGSLDVADVRALVAYLRTLCNCAGPSWSR